MKLSGFTLVRKGVQFDYPFLESIQSLLPLVDELVINVGQSEDETLKKIQSLAEKEKKIHWFDSSWNLHSHLRGGTVLSQQTNLALDRCSSDWCFYLQADELLHEDDYSKIQKTIEQVDQHPEIEGLLFDYIHFYGSYDVIQHSRSAYRREVRIIRKSSTARSVGDAQSFRKQTGEKLLVVPSQGRIFHYGWVRHPNAMKEKTFFMDQLYHGAPSVKDARTHTPHTGTHYQYKKILGLFYFKTFYPNASHPLWMKERIAQKNWKWNLEKSPLVYSWKDLKKWILGAVEKYTGYRLFEYKSYKLFKFFNKS